MAAAGPRAIAVVQAAGRPHRHRGEHVVQAIVVPPDIGAVPRRAGGLVGVMAHGDQLVPVVRLDAWLCADDAATDAPALAPSSSPADARIVILREAGASWACWWTRWWGMQRCAAAALARLFHDERPDELFAGAVRLAEDAAPLALLEPARLAALAGTWCAEAGVALGDEPVARDATHARDGDAGAPRLAVAVFRIGDRLVGLDVDAVGEPRADARAARAAAAPSDSRAACATGAAGCCRWSTSAACWARCRRRTPAWMCVVRHGELVLGVLVHEIIDLHAVDVPAGDAAAAASAGAPRAADGARHPAGARHRGPDGAVSRVGHQPARPGRVATDAAATSPHTVAGVRGRRQPRDAHRPACRRSSRCRGAAPAPGGRPGREPAVARRSDARAQPVRRPAQRSPARCAPAGGRRGGRRAGGGAHRRASRR